MCIEFLKCFFRKFTCGTPSKCYIDMHIVEVDDGGRWDIVDKKQ